MLSGRRHFRSGGCDGENDCTAAYVKAWVAAAQGMTCPVRATGAPSPATRTPFRTTSPSQQGSSC
jgi:hypothetical protein